VDQIEYRAAKRDRKSDERD